jgi:hypothetical protein
MKVDLEEQLVSCRCYGPLEDGGINLGRKFEKLKNLSRMLYNLRRVRKSRKLTVLSGPVNEEVDECI